MTQYVEATARDDATFEVIAWEYDERPNWWKQTQLIWTFTRTTNGAAEAWFATRDLAVAEHKISEAYPTVNERALLRVLFLHVPLQEDETTDLNLTPDRDDKSPVRVATMRVPRFAREQLARLRRLQDEVKRLEPAVRDLIISSAQEVAEHHPPEIARFMFTTDTVIGDYFFYDLTPRQMHTWAKGTGSYELEALCLQEIETQQATSQQAAAERLQQADDQRGLRNFMERMKRSYFTPDTPEEAEAARLHRVWKQAWNDPRNRPRLAAERDAYIINNIVRNNP